MCVSLWLRRVHVVGHACVSCGAVLYFVLVHMFVSLPYLTCIEFVFFAMLKFIQ